ncbi:MAG: CBS domain-containing protein [Acidimicrobiia bacterium]
MASVGDVVAEKGATVNRIAPDDTVFAAVKAMVDANSGSLLVSEDDEIVGIITERDYLRRVAIEGKTSKGTKVREIMTAEVIYVESSCDVEEALALMTDRRIRHLPVVDGDSLKGLVSIGDLVRFQTKEQSFQIRYLEEYISAR